MWRQSIQDFEAEVGRGIVSNDALRSSTDNLANSIRASGEAVGAQVAKGGFGSFLKFVTDLSSTLIGTGVPALLGFKTGMEGAGEAAAEATPEVERFAAAVNDVTEAQSEAIEDSDRFQEGLRKLGVTLESEVNEQLREQADLLLIADEAYRRGEITRRDFEAIERAIADAAEDSAEAIRDESLVVDGSTTAINTNTAARSANIAAIRGQASATADLSAATGDQIGQAGTHTTPGLAPSGGTFEFVDTSFAAQIKRAQLENQARLTASKNQRI